MRSSKSRSPILLSRSCRPWAHSRKNLVYLVPRVLTPRGLQIPHGAFHVRVP